MQVVCVFLFDNDDDDHGPWASAGPIWREHSTSDGV